jgi:FkbM family methyltransferase
MAISSLLNSLIRVFGIEVVRRRDRNFDVILSELFDRIGFPQLVIDVGAHNGSSINRFKKLFNQSTFIHSFEANPNLAEYLVAQFGNDKKIEIYLNAVSNVDRQPLTFNLHNTSTGSSSLLKVNQNRRFARRRNVSDATISPITVLSITLDSHVNESGFKHVNLLKIDTQGTELEVLKGASNLLSNSAIDVIELELIVADAYESASGTFDVLAFLDSYGYRLLALSNDGRFCQRGHSDILKNPELQFDVIFVSKKVFEQVSSTT